MIRKQYVNWFPLYEPRELGIKTISQKNFKGLKKFSKKKNSKLIIPDDYSRLLDDLMATPEMQKRLREFTQHYTIKK